MSKEAEKPFLVSFQAWVDKVVQYDETQRASILKDLNEHLAFILEKAEKEKPKVEAKVEVKAEVDAVTGSRPSSKVTHAPGGSSSISFGSEEAVETRSSTVRKQPSGGVSHGIFGSSDDKGKSTQNNMSIAAMAKRKEESSSIFDDPTPVEVRSSTKTGGPPGGKSNVQIGGSETTEKPKGGSTGSGSIASAAKRKEETSSIFDDGVVENRSSTKTGGPPGGRSSVQIGSDDKKGEAKAEAKVEAKVEATTPDSGSGDVSEQLRNDISSAIYRKGKLKDTWNKFTLNGSKLGGEGLKVGIGSCGVNLSSAQAEFLIKKFAKDQKDITYSDFVRMLTV